MTMCGISDSLLAGVLSTQAWPFSLKWLPQPSYLVGGMVRDAILGRHSHYLDLDFVMPTGAVETAQAIAHHHKAGFVLLDAERQIARVVFDQTTVDFAQQVGNSLETDLQRRDFTVNAIAYDPHSHVLIDPLQGAADLQLRLLRMIAPENLQEDPLRLLRAYRQAAQLGFHLDPATQIIIRQLAPLLEHIAAERVQSELSYLLSSANSTPWLQAAWQDGLFKAWFPHAQAENLHGIAAIDQAVVTLVQRWPHLERELDRRIRDKAKAGSEETLEQKLAKSKTVGYRRTWLSTAKLATLVSSELSLAESELLRLKYSRAEIQAVLTLLKFLPQVRSPHWLENVSRREQYFLFQGVGQAFPALAVLAVAAGIEVTAIAPLIDRYLTPDDPVAHPIPLLTGKILMSTLKLSPGPQVGQLLSAVQVAQAEGIVNNIEEAIAFATQWLSQPTP